MRRRSLLSTSQIESHPDLPGAPKIGTDDSGNVVSYETTDEVSLNNSTIDTGFIPFDGKDFYIHLAANFPKPKYSVTRIFPTILNAMEEAYPWNGFIIRRDPRYSNNILFVHKSDIWTVSNTEDFDVTIKKIGGNLVVEGAVEEISTVIDYEISGLTITVGSSIDSNGNPWRYADCTIYEFYVNKL